MFPISPPHQNTPFWPAAFFVIGKLYFLFKPVFSTKNPPFRPLGLTSSSLLSDRHPSFPPHDQPPSSFLRLKILFPIWQSPNFICLSRPKTICTFDKKSPSPLLRFPWSHRTENTQFSLNNSILIMFDLGFFNYR